jgi:EAL domain-containing protein (putative c-di-GMP-specific phosphodiesterase class I)
MTSHAKSPGDGRLPSQEAALLDYVQRLDRHRAGRRAVHVHLSKLRPYNRRDQHLRIARNTFENLVRSYEGQIFALANVDIVFICKGATTAALDAAVLKMRYLFSEDPIAQGDDPATGDKFCTWYDLERDYDDLLAAAEKIVAERERRNTEETAAAWRRPAPALTPLEPDQLGRVVQALARADLSNVIRRQPICAVLAGAPPQPIFTELFVSIADLQRVVAPQTHLGSNRWLFQYLTETLDKRMLATLPKLDDSSVSARISINLNVATLLSQEFLNFDAALRGNARGTLVIELQAIDVFADLGSFIFTRDFVRERGYRLCLDGLSHLTAPLIDREKLGLDLLKIVWSSDMCDPAMDRRLADIKELIGRAGEARVILCRCDNADAISIGQSLGITLFQGRHVDALLGAATKKPPPAGAKPATR